MSNSGSIVIVGAEIAGVHAAESLRKEGYEGRVILIDRDTEMPYDRPPLSKEWMVGDVDDSSLPLQDSTFYRDNDIELMLGVEVTSVDPDNKTIETKHGQQLSWDRLLLATGSDLKELNVSGNELEGIFYLRTLSDAKAIKQHLENVEKAVIVGAGFIGSELASSLSRLGIDVTIVEQAPYPMEQVVGREVGEYFLNMHRSHGVTVITKDSVAEFHGDGSLKEVETANSRKLPCQMAIIGVGVTPNTKISHPQLKVQDGYIVDEYGETSLPDVYAAGDCTMWPYRGKHIHIEHWENAANQGKTVAKNLIHRRSQAFTFQPYFWSDQYDQNFEYLGHATEWSQTVLRGSFEKGEFTMFYLDDNHVVKAAFVANQSGNGEAIGRLIEEQTPVDPEALGDEQVSLEKVSKK